jgi:hypothetical protein
MEILVEGVFSGVGIFISALEMIADCDSEVESLQAKNKRRESIVVKNFM